MKEKRKYKTVVSWRRKARLLFRILLAIGLIVQSVEFLEIYLQYPSTVELEVVQPPEFELPAFTVCNINEIRTSLYCDRYPQSCGTRDSNPGICVRFPAYCRLVNDTKRFPLHGQEEYRRLSREEQQKLGHQYNDFVQGCTVMTDDVVENCASVPILVPALSTKHEIPFNCYMLYSLHKQPNKESKRVPISTKITLILNLEGSEYLPEHLMRGAQISIHPPYHVPSPVSEGLFLDAGTVYKIYVRLAEKILLPYPYRSNCTDYLSLWEKNGREGPVTEKMCKEKCKLEKSLKRFGCVERRVDYPHNYSICIESNSTFTAGVRTECADRCSSPCKMQRYELQVQQADSIGPKKKCNSASDLSCATIVHIIFENLDITTFKYMARYEGIGILSFIGGYVGLWLGISLLTVYDFLETRFFKCAATIRSYLKKHNNTSVLVAPRVDTSATRIFMVMK